MPRRSPSVHRNIITRTLSALSNNDFEGISSNDFEGISSNDFEGISSNAVIAFLAADRWISEIFQHFTKIQLGIFFGDGNRPPVNIESLPKDLSETLAEDRTEILPKDVSETLAEDRAEILTKTLPGNPGRIFFRGLRLTSCEY